MQYIVERRQNGKEIVSLVSEAGAAALRTSMDRKDEYVDLKGERIKLDSIIALSPYETWWKNDEQAQRSRGRYRCSQCFVVIPSGSSCSCVPRNIETRNLETPQLSTERLRAGWVRALKIARTYEGVKKNPLFASSIIKRYEIKDAELA